MYDKITKKDLYFGFSTTGIIIFILGVALGTLYSVSPVLLFGVLKLLFLVGPIWIPVVLGAALWQLWVRYIRARFFHKQGYTLLEIKLPREITKSPLAMEAVLSGMHQGSGETTFVDRYWLGKTRTWFSLEIVSIDGNVRFFIWTRKFFKDIVESQIYSQYPEVEILEVEDYTQGVFFEPEKTSVWGCDFKLTEPDAYPIKTYIDYGLDKIPLKEEQKIDPLANTLEFLGNCGPGHQIWIQIIIRVNKSTLGQKDWKKEAQAEIDTILNRDPKTKGPAQFSSTGFPIHVSLSEEEKQKASAIERSMNKLAFDAGIRVIYIAEADKFNPTNVVGVMGCLKQFNSNNLNKFTPTRYNVAFNYPWQDFRGIRKDRARRKIIRAYKYRSWFHAPYKTPWFVLTTEELATLFHFPGGVVQTPTVSRVPSKKAEAPSNLPT